jgi:hypothetical protein
MAPTKVAAEETNQNQTQRPFEKYVESPAETATKASAARDRIGLRGKLILHAEDGHQQMVELIAVARVR